MEAEAWAAGLAAAARAVEAKAGATKEAARVAADLRTQKN